MKTTITVTQEVSVELDESTFTPEFLAEYSKHIGDLESVDDHVVNLARMFATGLIDGYPTEFVEGYGQLSEKGIKLKLESIDTEETGIFW